MSESPARRISGRALLFIVLIIGAFIALFPFYWMIVTSLKTSKEVYLYPPTWIPNPVAWSNYREAFAKVNGRVVPLRTILENGDQIRFVVNRINDGQPLAGKIRSAWEGILQDAGLGEDVVRHSLRHTAATWLMQAGVDMWEAAGWLGMTVEQLEANYGHHHPDFQEEAAVAFGGRR